MSNQSVRDFQDRVVEWLGLKGCPIAGRSATSSDAVLPDPESMLDGAAGSEVWVAYSRHEVEVFIEDMQRLLQDFTHAATIAGSASAVASSPLGKGPRPRWRLRPQWRLCSLLLTCFIADSGTMLCQEAPEVVVNWWQQPCKEEQDGFIVDFDTYVNSGWIQSERLERWGYSKARLTNNKTFPLASLFVIEHLVKEHLIDSTSEAEWNLIVEQWHGNGVSENTWQTLLHDGEQFLKRKVQANKSGIEVLGQIVELKGYVVFWRIPPLVACLMWQWFVLGEAATRDTYRGIWNYGICFVASSKGAVLTNSFISNNNQLNTEAVANIVDELKSIVRLPNDVLDAECWSLSRLDSEALASHRRKPSFSGPAVEGLQTAESKPVVGVNSDAKALEKGRASIEKDTLPMKKRQGHRGVAKGQGEGSLTQRQGKGQRGKGAGQAAQHADDGGRTVQSKAPPEAPRQRQPDVREQLCSALRERDALVAEKRKWQAEDTLLQAQWDVLVKERDVLAEECVELQRVQEDMVAQLLEAQEQAEGLVQQWREASAASEQLRRTVAALRTDLRASEGRYTALRNAMRGHVDAAMATREGLLWAMAREQAAAHGPEHRARADGEEVVQGLEGRAAVGEADGVQGPEASRAAGPPVPTADVESVWHAHAAVLTGLRTLMLQCADAGDQEERGGGPVERGRGLQGPPLGSDPTAQRPGSSAHDGVEWGRRGDVCHLTELVRRLWRGGRAVEVELRRAQEALCHTLTQCGASDAALRQIDAALPPLDGVAAEGATGEGAPQPEALEGALEAEVERLSRTAAVPQRLQHLHVFIAELLGRKEITAQALTARNAVLEAGCRRLRDAAARTKATACPASRRRSAGESQSSPATTARPKKPVPSDSSRRPPRSTKPAAAAKRPVAGRHGPAAGGPHGSPASEGTAGPQNAADDAQLPHLERIVEQVEQCSALPMDVGPQTTVQGETRGSDEANMTHTDNEPHVQAAVRPLPREGPAQEYHPGSPALNSAVVEVDEALARRSAPLKALLHLSFPQGFTKGRASDHDRDRGCTPHTPPSLSADSDYDPGPDPNPSRNQRSAPILAGLKAVAPQLDESAQFEEAMEALLVDCDALVWGLEGRLAAAAELLCARAQEASRPPDSGEHGERAVNQRCIAMWHRSIDVAAKVQRLQPLSDALETALGYPCEVGDATAVTDTTGDAAGLCLDTKPQQLDTTVQRMEADLLGSSRLQQRYGLVAVVKEEWKRRGVVMVEEEEARAPLLSELENAGGPQQGMPHAPTAQQGMPHALTGSQGGGWLPPCRLRADVSCSVRLPHRDGQHLDPCHTAQHPHSLRGAENVAFIGIEMAEELLVDAGDGRWVTSGGLESGGVRVLLVRGPAMRDGVCAGDVVTHVDGQPTNSLGHVQTAVGRINVGETVFLTVVRGAETLNIPVRTGQVESTVFLPGTRHLHELTLCRLPTAELTT